MMGSLRSLRHFFASLRQTERSSPPYADGSIFVIHDGEWAAIPFQRPLASVPADFNLFDWFDPALLGNPNVPLLIEGHAIWEAKEPIGVPAITEARGRDAIPVVFVKLAEWRRPARMAS